MQEAGGYTVQTPSMGYSHSDGDVGCGDTAFPSVSQSPFACCFTCVHLSPVRFQGWKLKTKQKTPEEAEARWNSGIGLFRDAVRTSLGKR